MQAVRTVPAEPCFPPKGTLLPPLPLLLLCCWLWPVLQVPLVLFPCALYPAATAVTTVRYGARYAVQDVALAYLSGECHWNSPSVPSSTMMTYYSGAQQVRCL
jgi:hypothetical protein